MIDPTTSEGGNPHILALAPSPSDIEFYRATLDHHANCHMIVTPLQLELALRERQWDLILCDFSTTVPAEILAVVKHQAPATPLIFVAESATVPDAVAMMRLGARGFVDKAYPQQLAELMEEELHSIVSPHPAPYASIVELQTELVCRYDLDFRLTFVNRAYCEWLNQSAAALLGQNILEAIPTDERQQVATQIQSRTPDHPAYVAVHQAPRYDGELRWLEWTNQALFDAEGRCVGYQGVGRDVTEREERYRQLQVVKEELDRSRQQLTEILDTTQEGLMSLSLPDRQLIFISTSFERVFGYPVETFLNDPAFFEKVVHPDDFALATEAMQTCLREGFVEVEHRVVLPDGTIRWLHRRAWVNFDEQGRPIRVNDSARDITAQKHSQAELRFHSEILRNLSEGVNIVRASDQTFTYVNPAFEQTFGYEPGELIGQHVSVLNAATSATPLEVADDITDQLQKAGSYSGEVRTVRKDGSLFWSAGSIVAFDHAEYGPIWISVQHDITAQKAAQDALNHQATLLEQISDVVIQMDQQYVITAWNRAATTTYGWTEAEVIGQTVHKLLQSQFLSATTDEIDVALETTGMWRGHVVEKTRGGGSVHVMVSISRLYRQGEFVGYIAVNRDITATHRRATFQHNIATVLEAIANAEPLPDVLTKLVETVEKYQPIIRASVLLAETETERLLHGAAPSLPEAYCAAIHGIHYAPGVGSCGTAAAEKRLVIVEDIQTDPLWKDFRELAGQHNLRACWSQPILGENNVVLGTFALYYDHVRAPSADELELIGLAGHVAGIAIRRIRAENELRASEERYRAVVQDQSESVCRYTADLRVTFGNRAYCEQFGVPPEKIVGQSILTRIPPEEHERVLAHVRALTPENPIAVSIHHGIGLDGSLTWTEWKDRAIFDEQGQITEYQGVGRDITEQRRAEEALRASEDLFKQFMNHLPAAVYINNDKDQLTYCSPVYAESLGVRAEAMIGKTLTEYAWPGLAEIAAAEDRQVLAANHALTFDSIDHTGGQYWRITKFPLPQPNGSTWLAAIGINVTAEKQAETARRTSEERYRRIIEDQTEFVVRYDDQLRVTFANSAYCRAYGYAPETVVGVEILPTIPAEAHDRMWAYLHSMTPENPTGFSAHPSTQADGKVHWVEWKDRAILDEQGQIVEYQGVGRDVTEQRIAEEALRESEARLRSLLNSQSNFVLRTDMLGCLTYWNAKFEQEWGWLHDNGNILGTSGLVSICQHHHERARETVEKCLMQPGTVFTVDLDKPARDGGIRTTLWEFVALTDENGNPTEMQCIGVDVSARRRAEEALRASEEKYRSLVESSDALIMMLSLDGTILYSNAIAAAHYHATPETMVGKTFRDLYPPDALADRKAKLDDMVQTGQGLHFEARSATHDEEMWFSVTLQPIRNDAGEIVAAFINSQDITERRRAEEALRASEEKYRSLIESSDSRIMMLGPDGTILFVNEIGAAHYHTTPEALTGKNLRDIYPPEVADGRLAFLDRVFSSGQGITTEIRSTTYQEPRWFRSAVQPVRDGNGQMYAVLSNSIDITDRKLAEEALRASEEHFRFLFKNNPHPMWVYDLETLAFLEVNDSAVDKYGYAPDEFLAMRLPDIRPADDVARLIEDTALDRPVIQHSGEWRHKLKNGQVIPVEITSHTLNYAGHQAALVVAQDITERKLAEEALQSAHALLEQRVIERTEELERAKDRIEAIFNHSGGGILLLDLAHGVQQTNYAFDQMFNLPPDSAVGLGLPLFFDLADADHIARMVQEVAHTHQTLQIEARALRLGGTAFDAEISLAPVNRSDKAVSSLVCIVRDVSERKQAQDALAKYVAEVYDLYHYAPTGYHSLDKDGTIIRINNTELIWLGYVEHEVVGKLKFTDLITPASRETFYRAFPVFLAQGHITDVELEVIRKDGSTFWALVNATAIYDADGHFTHSRSSLMDITELKQVQRAVAEERNLLRTVVDTVPDFIYVKDMQHRMILNNVAHAATLGVGSPAEAIGKTDLEMFPRELAEKFHADEDRIFATGEPMLRVEERSLGKQGGDIWALTTKIPLRNLAGEMIGLVGTTHDVTDMKLSEEALRRSQADLRSVLDSTNTMYVLVDRDGTIRLVNRLAQAASMTGNDQPLGIGTPAVECIPEPFRDNFRARFARVLQGEHITEVFSAIRSGMPSFLEFRYYPVRDQDGHVIGMTIAADDITERKATEQQLRYLASLQDQMHEAVIGVNLEYHIQSWNKAAERMYGWTMAEILGKISSEVLRTEPVSGESIAEVRATLNEAGFWRGEAIHYHRNGTPVWVSATVSTIYDADGKPTGYIIVGHDVTAQKAAERVIEQKRRHEQEMQGYLKALHEITLVLTRANTLDEFYRLTVQEGMEHFGFERMGLLLLDHTDGAAIGTYGTDPTGTVVPEHHLRIEPASLTGILKRTLDRHERVAYDEHADLFFNLEKVAEGQNAVAALWNGEVLGWLAIDNGVYQVPISQAQLDILALYALTAGSLLARKRAEFALRESEARYRFLAENIPDVIVKFSLEGIYTYVSPSSSHLTGHTPEELLGTSVEQHVHPDDWAAGQAAGLAVTMAGGSVFTVTQRLRHKDGHYIWVETTSNVIRDVETGAPSELLSLVHDITERKAAEDALRESEARYRFLAENIHDVIIKLSIEGQYTYVSPSCFNLTQHAPEDILASQPDALLHPDDWMASFALGQQVIDSGGTFFTFVARLRHKAGHYVWVEVNNTIVRDIETGAPIEFISLVHDITERKAAEDALRESEERYRLLAENITDAILKISPAGLHTYVSPSSRAITGHAPEELLGKSTYEFVHPDDLAILGEAVQQAIESGRAFFTLVHRLRHTDGHYVWVEVTTTIVRDPQTGEIAEYVSLVHDITERKAAEDALRESEERYRLLAENVHDVIIKSSADGLHTYVSPASRELVGYAPEELIGISTAEFVHPDDRADLADFSGQIIAAGGNFFSFVHRLRRKDGDYVWVESTTTVVRDAETGLPREFISLVRDITERKAAVDALRESEARYRLLAENIQDVIVKIAPNGIRTFATASVQRLLGFQPEEIVGQIGLDLVHPDERPKTGEVLRSVLGSSATFFTVTHRMRHKDGHYVWIEATNTVVRDAITNAPLEIIALLHDISERKAAEDALRESEERYRLLAERVTDVIFKYSLTQGKRTYVTPSCYQLFGYTAEELLQEPQEELTHPDDRPSVMLALQNALRNQATSFSFVQRSRCKDGHYVWVEVIETVVHDAITGEPTDFIAVVRDITERKAAEDALRDSEERYRLLAENVQDVIVRFDANFVRTYATPSTKHLVGYEPEEIYGQSLGSLTHPDDVALLKSRLDEAVQAGATTFSVAIRLVHRDGHAVWVEVNATIVREAMTGAVLEFIAIIHDITERKAAEDALRQSEANFRKYVESAPLATIISDFRGQIVVVNGAAEQLFGYPRHELVGQPIEVLVPDDLRGNHADHRTRFENMPASRRRHPLELPARRKDGTIFPADIQLSEIDTQPTPMVMSLTIDVTERNAAAQALQEALEQEREMVNLKSRFVSMASHEFRTPLAAILATTDTLTIYRDRMDAGQIDQRLDKIRQQVNHMKDIMEEVLELARIQAGRVDYKPSTNDLDAMCQEIIEEFDSQAAYRGRMVYTCPVAPLIATFDRRLMRQIISNLISNALKYSPAEKPVHIGLFDEVTQWVLTVQDEGIGIPAKDLRHLFEPFHRASNVGTISGTGLGLSITKQAVDLHRGTIVPESVEGMGTTFVVTLPKSREETA